MNKKIMIISIIAAALLALLPISSVVGTNSIESKENLRSVSSPLFSVRSKQMINNEDMPITSNYLGKGKLLTIFGEKSTLNYNLQRALRFIENNPLVLNKLLDKIITEPTIYDTLSEYDVSQSEFKSYVNAIKNDHSTLIENLKSVDNNLPMDTSLPLGFNETNPLAIIILIIVFAPIILSLAIIIATITIITCLNIAGCFEAIAYGMLYGFFQGLKQPN